MEKSFLNKAVVYVFSFETRSSLIRKTSRLLEDSYSPPPLKVVK